MDHLVSAGKFLPRSQNCHENRIGVQAEENVPQMSKRLGKVGFHSISSPRDLRHLVYIGGLERGRQLAVTSE